MGLPPRAARRRINIPALQSDRLGSLLSARQHSAFIHNTLQSLAYVLSSAPDRPQDQCDSPVNVKPEDKHSQQEYLEIMPVMTLPRQIW